jgi:hypothetical protein
MESTFCRGQDTCRQPAAVERETVVDPIAQPETNNIHHHLKNDEFATPLGLSGFCLPDRSGGRVYAITNAVCRLSIGRGN